MFSHKFYFDAGQLDQIDLIVLANGNGWEQHRDSQDPEEFLVSISILPKFGISAFKKAEFPNDRFDEL